MSTKIYDWKEGKWPKEKAVCYFETGKGNSFRGEVISSGGGYDIKVRYRGIMVASDYLHTRGEGSVGMAKGLAERLFEQIREDING